MIVLCLMLSITLSAIRNLFPKGISEITFGTKQFFLAQASIFRDKRLTGFNMIGILMVIPTIIVSGVPLEKKHQPNRVDALRLSKKSVYRKQIKNTEIDYEFLIKYKTREKSSEK